MSEGSVSRARRVVVGGAINTDLVAGTTRYPQRGETVTGTSFAMFGGGKGGNQAVAAARSGATVAIVGGVGEDAFGRDRLADLDAEGIETAGIQHVSGASSGVALIAVEGGDNRILYVPGATLLVEPEQAVSSLGEGPVGVLLITLELQRPVLDRLIARTRRDGGIVVLNATPEPERAATMLREVDVLIVNESEAVALLDAPPIDPEDWLAIASRLRTQGAAAVLVTLGSKGALWVDGTGSRIVSAPAVDVVDTTGAGDSLCGAFAAVVARGGEYTEAVRFGVAAGSLACTIAGAQPSIPTRAAVEQVLTGTDIPT